MENTKPLQSERALADRKRVVAEVLAKKRDARQRTLDMLKRFRTDLAPGRDAELVKACLRIRRKIVDENYKWLPKFLFNQHDGPLFYVEGTSTATLFNYIPNTDQNVYAVYERNVVVNYTGLDLRLTNWNAVDIPDDCEFICTNVVIFDTDLVATRDSLLAELFAQRIDFYSKYKR